MKKSVVVAMAVLWGALAAPGNAEEINWVGTENGEPIFEAVAQTFDAAHPDVSVKVPPSIDSGGGIKAVATDRARIARVARGFIDGEKAYDLSMVPFAKVQIVFYVHPDVSIQNLSSKQVCGIYEGSITNWKELGGANLPIRVVTREPGDSAAETLEDNLPGFEDIEVTTRSKTVFDEPASVASVANKRGAIGFGSYGFAANRDVKIIDIDGKDPLAPDYPLALTLGMVFKEENRTGIIEAFVSFAQSPEAREPILRAGGSPLE